MTRALSLATFDQSLPDGGTVPEWVHLLPSGKMTGRDGRTFQLSDPQAVIALFERGQIDLPIDYEHQNDKPEARLSGPVPAAGWIKELLSTATGIWGRVSWTEQARALIGRKEYRFLSPSILYHPKSREVMQIKGAGLVHNPALFLTALASQETPMPPENEAPNSDLLAALVELLGLDPQTPLEVVMASLKERLTAKPNPKDFVPVSALQEVLRGRNGDLATMAEGRAQEKVNAAFRAGYITPGMRPWALDLCRSDEAAFDGFLQGVGPTFAYLTKPADFGQAKGQGAVAQRTADSDLAAAICAQLGLPADALNSQ